MEREIDVEFHHSIPGKTIKSLSYSCAGDQVSYVTIYLKDGSTLGIGLDCTPEEHSLGFHVDESNRKVE